MSSLRTILRKGKIFVPDTMMDDPEKFDYYSSMVRRTMTYLMSPDTILVNVQSVYADVSLVNAEDQAAAILRVAGWMGNPADAPPRPMPPFANMWLEYETEFENRKQKQGVLIHRTNPGDSYLNAFPELQAKLRPIPDVATAVDMWFWSTDPDQFAFVGGGGSYLLSEAGEFVYSGRWLMPRSPHNEPGIQRHAIAFNQFSQGVVLHSFARMNCGNAELRVISEGKSIPHHKPAPAPACVWHTIHVSAIGKKALTTGKDAMREEPAIQRSRWIRGHYADYRGGAGLFGNPKLRKVFWISEHTVGNPHLGIVIPEYVIH